MNAFGGRPQISTRLLGLWARQVATDPTRYACRKSIDSEAHLIFVLCDAKYIDFSGFGAADFLKSSDWISWQLQNPGVV